MPLRILKASAGSGKTYSLTETYIRYCLDGGNSLDYTNILAITFTNKASAEMKDRIINLLHTLSIHPEDYPGIDKLCKDLNISREEIKTRSKHLLNRVLRNFDQFTITTIDSFFTRLYTSMTLDLFGDAPRDISFDRDKALDYAADQLIKAAQDNEELRTVIIDLLEEKIREGEGVGLHRSLKKLGAELFNDAFLELRDDKQYREPVRNFHKALTQAVDLILSECKQYKERIKSIMERGGMQHQDFSRKFTETILKRDTPLELIKLKSFGKLSDPEQWFTKKDKDAKMIKVAPVMDELQQAGQEYFAYVQENYRSYTTYRSVLDNYAAYRILRFLDKVLQEYLEEQKLIFLSDINLKIHQNLTVDDAMVVYEKIGQRLHSVMIDEFQDTSQIQWNNLKPFILNNMAEANPNLVVGDVKQAIYRFRNGNWEIMEIQVPEFQKMWEGKSSNESLETNWRSSPEIISFNNDFFVGLSERLTDVLIGFKQHHFSDTGRDHIPSAAFQDMEALTEAPRSIYGGALQHVSPKNEDQTGYVELNYWSYTRDTEKDRVLEARMEWFKMVISELHEEGFSGSDIGILARGKKEMGILSEYLTRWSEDASNFRFSSENSLRLDLSDGVQLLIAGLKMKTGIDAAVNKLVFINYLSKLQYGGSSDRDWKDSFYVPDNEYLEVLESELFQKHGIDQLASFFESLTDATGLAEKPGQWPYLLTFIEEVKKFEIQHGPDVRLFLDEWDQRIRNVQIQMSDDEGKMRLITIHKSKGLEFEVVLIPFGGWDFEISGQSDTLWVKNQQDDLLKLAGPLPISYKNDLFYSVFDYALMNEYLRNVVDNLNLLYVAMTRPRQRLYIRLQAKETGYRSTNEFEKPIKNTLDLFRLGFDNLETGKIVKGTKFPATHDRTSTGKPSGMRLEKYHFRHRPMSLHLRPSFDGTSDESIGKGLIIHRMLEEIEYRKDIQSAVAKSILAGDIRAKDRDEWSARLREILSFAPVNDFFEDHWRVYNERSIMVVGGAEFRPDRVQENGKEYIIIDYKTGAPNASHESQIQTYKNIVGSMVKLPVRGFIYYPLIPELVEVR